MPWSCFRNKTFDIFEPSDRDNFFVVTAIFNPVGFASRYELYHNFAKHMQERGVQLMTVEAIFPTLGQTQFQVTQPGNPLHVQVISNSVYWMKENLLNVGVSRLPPHAKWVCWLDADITFLSRNWVQETLSELKKYEVVQVFKKAKFLGPPPSNKVLRTDYSFGYSVVHSKIIDQSRYSEWYPHPGYGWAMSISSFRAMGGLPIHDIVGSGDLHFAFSLLNRVSNALEDELHPDFKSHILQISNHTFEKLSSIAKANGKGGVVGYSPGTICHNWHGSRADRQYVDRWKILIAHQFNFHTDVVVTDSGLLEFVGPKANALQGDILTHFRIRKEDGKQVTGQDTAVFAATKITAVKQKPKHIKNKVKVNKVGKKSSTSSTPVDRGEWFPPPDGGYPPPECPPDPGSPCPDPECPPDHDCPHPHHPGDGYPGSDGDGGYNSIHTSTQY